MNNLNNAIQEALTRYHGKLSIFGYCDYESVYRLLISCFIEQIIDNQLMAQFITDDDYRVLQQTLYNLYGSNCLIPYPEFVSEEDLTQSSIEDFTPRVTENNILRAAENGDTVVS